MLQSLPQAQTRFLWMFLLMTSPPPTRKYFSHLATLADFCYSFTEGGQAWQKARIRHLIENDGRPGQPMHPFETRVAPDNLGMESPNQRLSSYRASTLWSFAGLWEWYGCGSPNPSSTV